MNLVFMGSPDFSADILRALLKGPDPVSLVVAQPDRAKGRKGTATPCPVREVAIGAGIRSFCPERIRDPEAIREVLSAEPDLIIVAAFGQIIPSELLHTPRFGCINVHASLLPAYRGATPIQQAIADGCPKTGITIMQMDEGLDTGDILTQREIAIDPDETSGSLFQKIGTAGAELLLETIPAVFDGSCPRIPQPKDSPTPMTRRLKKEDGRISFEKSAEEIERRIRAMDPWPGAFTLLDGRNCKIWKAYTEEAGRTGEAGTILGTENGILRVQCASGVLCITELQPEGKKRMAAEAFLRGHTIRNEHLGETKETA